MTWDAARQGEKPAQERLLRPAKFRHVDAGLRTGQGRGERDQQDLQEIVALCVASARIGQIRKARPKPLHPVPPAARDRLSRSPCEKILQTSNAIPLAAVIDCVCRAEPRAAAAHPARTRCARAADSDFDALPARMVSAIRRCSGGCGQLWPETESEQPRAVRPIAHGACQRSFLAIPVPGAVMSMAAADRSVILRPGKTPDGAEVALVLRQHHTYDQGALQGTEFLDTLSEKWARRVRWSAGCGPWPAACARCLTQ